MQTTKPPRPLEVRRDVEARTVAIRWDDGHESVYGYRLLRGWCPCAGCQGHGNTVRFIDAGEPMLVKISVVGNYALGFVWSDGHDSGIYPYYRLRNLGSEGSDSSD